MFNISNDFRVQSIALSQLFAGATAVAMTRDSKPFDGDYVSVALAVH